MARKLNKPRTRYRFSMKDKYEFWGYIPVAKSHNVCFHCRVSFKERSVCPHCHRPLIDAGKKFKPPRRNDARNWKRLHILYMAKHDWDKTLSMRDAKELFLQGDDTHLIDDDGRYILPYYRNPSRSNHEDIF